LLRESAKATKEVKERKMFRVSKRLGAEEEKDQVMSSEALGAEKRHKAADGKGVPASQRLGGAGMMSQGKT
jgi:hypothetical protein